MKFKLAALALAMAFCISGCASAPTAVGGAPALVNKSLPAPDSLINQAGAEHDYQIGPLDLLDITVFQAPDLTRTVQVDGGGGITLPLIGMTHVAGLTALQAGDKIAAVLAQHYLQDPQVSIFVKQAESQKFTVEGAVTTPGVYPITGRTTLLQALATAKGTTSYANNKGVAIFRSVNQQRMAAVYDINGIRDGKYPDPEVFGNDTVVVNEVPGKKMFFDVVQASPLLGLLRPY